MLKLLNALKFASHVSKVAGWTGPGNGPIWTVKLFLELLK